MYTCTVLDKPRKKRWREVKRTGQTPVELKQERRNKIPGGKKNLEPMAYVENEMKQSKADQTSRAIHVSDKLSMKSDVMSC